MVVEYSAGIPGFARGRAYNTSEGSGIIIVSPVWVLGPGPINPSGVIGRVGLSWIISSTILVLSPVNWPTMLKGVALK